MRRTVTDYIVVHTTATKPTQDIGAEWVDELHKARGWRGIGYHSIIRIDGRREFGRHYDEVGAHSKGHNRRSVATALVGGLDAAGEPANTYSAAQLDTLLLELRALKRSYPQAKIVGHRDLSPDIDGDGVIEPHEWLKSCPCFDVRAWLGRVAPRLLT